MKPKYWMTFYAVFGGLAVAAGYMTITRSPGYEPWGIFGIAAGFYGFYQSLKWSKVKK